MATTPTNLVLTRIGRRRLTELAAKAKRLGLTPERYVKRLVAEDLAMDREARSTPFTELFVHRPDVDDEELDRLVEEARKEHHPRSVRKGLSLR